MIILLLMKTQNENMKYLFYSTNNTLLMKQKNLIFVTRYEKIDYICRC
jgi:hypothetical protein